CIFDDRVRGGIDVDRFGGRLIGKLNRRHGDVGKLEIFDIGDSVGTIRRVGPKVDQNEGGCISRDCVVGGRAAEYRGIFAISSVQGIVSGAASERVVSDATLDEVVQSVAGAVERGATDKGKI